MCETTKNQKVLVIEDDKFIRRALTIGLTKSGFDVSVASDGEEGLQKIKSEKPNLVLLDLIMPVKNGFDVLEDIKISEGDLTKIPIIILSNLEQGEDIKKCEDLGAVDYFVKSNMPMKEAISKVKYYLAKFK